MPSFQDSAVIFFIALLLFGPKKLPELARYIGKLMGEFRRASSEFRMQMEDEFRQSEQAEQQKKIAAMEAAAPIAPALPESTDTITDTAVPYEPHAYDPDTVAISSDSIEALATVSTPEPEAISPLPIASSGELDLMPPATGLPVARSSSLGGVFDSIPHTPDPAAMNPEPSEQAHG